MVRTAPWSSFKPRGPVHIRQRITPNPRLSTRQSPRTATRSFRSDQRVNELLTNTDLVLEQEPYWPAGRRRGVATRTDALGEPGVERQAEDQELEPRPLVVGGVHGQQAATVPAASARGNEYRASISSWRSRALRVDPDRRAARR